MVCLFACGKGDEAKPAVASGSGSAPAAQPTAGSGAAPAPPVDAAPAPPPLSPKIKAARCSEPCLFLVDTPIDKLVDAYKTECGGMQTKELGFSDCKQLDYVRNCIYAAHGVVYKKKKWKQLFEKKPWYEPSAEASAKTALVGVELANVHELNTRGKACKKGLSISSADIARVNAWLAGWPKHLKMPKVLFEDDKSLKKAEFSDAMTREFQDRSLKLGKGTQAYYDEGGLSGPFVDAVAKVANAKPQIILLIISSNGATGGADDPIWDGTHVWLAYDDKELVGVDVGHFTDGE
jgi:hypothetical protein